MFESVQLLCQLPYPHLQLLVFLLQLHGPLLGQQDPPASLVPALSHSDVVSLSSQPVLCTVLADAPLVYWGPQSWQEEGGEILLSVGVALVVVCVPRAQGVAEAGRHVRHVRQSHHLLRHSVITAPSHQSLRLAVCHVHLSQLIGWRVRVQGVGVSLTRV